MRELNMQEAILLEAKKSLYSLLLKKGNLNDNESEIMYFLSRDEQIQELLNKKRI